MQTAMADVAHDTDTEYRAIEATLLQTARGRWFLSEHGRRARRLDSAMLEEAIARLQSSLRDPPALLGQLRNEIEEVKTHLTKTKLELATRGRLSPVAEEAAASGAVIEAAPAPGGPAIPQGILTAAEDIHELAWSLQAKAPDAESCEQIARHAARLYAMSLQQAVESERLARLAAAIDTASLKLTAILETLTFESSEAPPAPSAELGSAPQPVRQSISAILPPPMDPPPAG
jgi:hypothetical protein